MLDRGWNDMTTSSQIDWREVDLIAERIGALPDAPLLMPMQSFGVACDLARQNVWMRLRSVLTARAGH